MNRFTVFLLALSFGVLSAYAKRTKVPTLTYTNVPYDQYERTKVDFWQAEGKGPRPLMVFIHGGGWSQGSKDKKRENKRNNTKGNKEKPKDKHRKTIGKPRDS